MAKYMLLIYVPAPGGPSREELEAQLPRWWDYTRQLADTGALVADEALEAPDAARTLRVRGGARQITDGPCAATSEVLGGFYVIDVADWAAAEEWAAKIPSAPYGSVEIRPVMEFADAPA